MSSTEIDVGTIANVTGPLSSGFAPLVNGVQAYFSMINAQGGVAGRKLKLAHQEDDQGNPTVDLTAAQQLVEQDHVFAVVGVGTPFFGGASYLAQQGTPTFGYVVSTDWENKPTLFGDYGSVLDFATATPGDAYVAQRLGAQSVGVVAYGRGAVVSRLPRPRSRASTPWASTCRLPTSTSPTAPTPPLMSCR